MSRTIYYRRLWVPLLVLGAFQPAVGVATARPAPDTAATNAGASPNRDPATILTRIKQLTTELKLSTGQQTQIDAIFTKAEADRQSAAQEMKDASAQEKMAKFRELLASLRERLANVLDDTQNAELTDKLQALRQTLSPANANAGPTSGPTGPRTPAGLMQRLKDNLDQLNLADEQKARIDDVLKSTQQQMQDMRSQIQAGTLQQADARPKIAEIVNGTRQKIMAVLTAQQQQSLIELMQQANEGVGATGGAVRRFGPNHQRLSSETAATGPSGAGAASASDQSQAPDQVASLATSAPAVGQSAGPFTLKNLNGETVQLSSFKNKLLVLAFGCYSEPTFRDHAAGLEALRDQYGSSGVSFLIVYTKETHPVGGWEVERNKAQEISVAQPKTEDERRALARQAQTTLKLSVAVAPDTMDDQTARAYAASDGCPAYMIGRDGKIQFEQAWLEPNALGRAIGEAVATK